MHQGAGRHRTTTWELTSSKPVAKHGAPACLAKPACSVMGPPEGVSPHLTAKLGAGKERAGDPPPKMHEEQRHCWEPLTKTK